MKIYIVVGDNLELYEDNYRWNDAVFFSRKAAERYISEQPARFIKEQKRYDELELKKYEHEGGLTEAEEEEFQHISDQWYWCRKAPRYSIEEHDVRIR